MPRLHGCEIPADRPAAIALTALYGVGRARALEVLERAGIPSDTLAGDLEPAELLRLELMLRSYGIEGELRRELRDAIKRLKDIGCHRGLRHRRNLPTRGQRTRSNARTRKGPRKTIAGSGR